MNTRLFIQFAETDTLKDTIDLIRAACTILPENPASVPIETEKGQHYFSLNVDISFDQIKAALANNDQPLGPKPEQMVGMNQSLCLFYDGETYQVWYADVKFKDRKLIATLLGQPSVVYQAR